MTLPRRDALRLLAAGGLVTAAGVSGCALLGGTPTPRMLPSKAALPEPFQVPLPVPAVAEPTRRDRTTDYYDITQRATEQEILPGLPSVIWGYDGTFPGPTIRAPRGRRTVVRVNNGLPEPTVLHLHGGRTPPESDGYPTDLLQPNAVRAHEFPLDQRAATLWYHDHRMGFTAPQVWRGLVGFFLVEDPDEDALGLPRGERDVPLLICDRSFAEDGAMSYPGSPDRHGAREAYVGGVLGDVILVNGAPWPELRVSRTRYRFRLLNASNARTYELTSKPGSGLVQVGSDGGLLTAPRRLERVRLAPAERADVIVDFSAYDIGDRVELRNLDGEGKQGLVMRFAVDRNERDESRIPSRLSEIERLDPAKAKTTRDFDFARGSSNGHTAWLVNGKPFDENRMDARPALGDIEIWRFTSDVPHPIHLHLAHFQVLSVNDERVSGPPAWKDTVELRDLETVEIITRFTGYRGRYVFHCHNLEHEDMAMMANFEVV